MSRSASRAGLPVMLAVVALLFASCGVESRGADPSPSGDRPAPTEVAGESESGAGASTPEEPENFEGTGGAMLLRSAAESTADVRTQKFEIRIDMDGEPLAMSMTADGAVDLENDLLEMTMDFGGFDMGDMADAEMEGFDPSMLAITVVLADDTVYMRSPMLTMFGESDAEWIAIPADELGDESLDASMGNTQDPNAFLDFLRGTDSEVTEIGSEDVRGVPTTHYSTELNIRGIIEAADDDDRADMEEAMEAFGGDVENLPMDVWIDEDGMVRRMEMIYEIDEGGVSAVMTMTIELFDFDEPVGIAVPDPSNVMDMDDAGLGGLDF